MSKILCSALWNDSAAVTAIGGLMAMATAGFSWVQPVAKMPTAARTTARAPPHERPRAVQEGAFGVQVARLGRMNISAEPVVAPMPSSTPTSMVIPGISTVVRWILGGKP